MKAQIAAIALASALAAPAVRAQGPAPRTRSGLFGGFRPSAPAQRTPPGMEAAPAAQPEKVDARVFPANAALPTPTPPDQIGPATIAMPTEAIEPYLLTKAAGPFMVKAKAFRGPDSDRYALALAIELRKEHGLPAYILRSKEFPGKSNIRDIPPTAPPGVPQGRLGEPEKTRTYDEAVVLVGNEKTLDGSEALLHRVKKIHPKCLDEMPSPLHWRKGLNGALRTTNPYVPAQNLFPRKSNTMMKQMNSGPHSIFNCPGRYTLQIAEFGGRSTFNPQDGRFHDLGSLKSSPLVTAASDAEKLATALGKDPEVQRTGFQPYVYHDMSSSKVMIGAFQSTQDPKAPQLRDSMLKLAVPLHGRKVTQHVIVPATNLTDIRDLTAR